MIYGLWFKTDSCQGVANKHAIINADIRENKNITYSDFAVKTLLAVYWKL